MKGLQITCLVLAMLALTAQSIRHLYVKYFEATASVLDKYDKKPIDQDIQSAKSLAELVAQYDPLRKQADLLDAQLDKELQNIPEDKKWEHRSEFTDAHKKDYEPERKLRAAINDWESKANEIRELRIFWFFGLGLYVLGGALYFKSRWVGLSLLIAGVIEMIWWTSPSFRLGGTVAEFERLLNNRLLFSILSLALVLLAWWLRYRLVGRKTEHA